MIKIDMAKLNHYGCPWGVLSDTVNLNVSENIAISSDIGKMSTYMYICICKII